MVGGPATTSSVRATATLPEGVGAAGDVGLKGGNNGSRRTCNAVSHARHDTFPEWVRAVNDVGLKGDSGGGSRRACDAVVRERHGASPGGGEGRW